MALRGNNFFYKVKLGNSIPAQSVATITTVAGRTISEPWRDGRQLSFILNGGAFAATASGRLKLEGLARSDGTTWTTLTGGDGSTVLEFTQTKLDDAGAAENGVLIGTVDLADIDSTTYSAVRCKWYNEVAVAQLVAVTDVISDLYEEPSATTDELFSIARPVTTP